MIHLKSMHNVPPRLQRMLLQLQKYDMKIEYKPGSEMLLTDALSRCPARYSQEVKLDLRVDYIAFTSAWIETLKETTCEDPALSTVYQLVQHRWPKERRRVPNVAKYYWDFRDECSTDKGLLLKGPFLIIPAALRESYLQCLHKGHLSASKTITNARQHMFWPGIEADIKDYTRRCQVCIKRSRPAREPLQPHEIPDGPWQKLGMDFFDLKDFISDAPSERAVTFNDNPVAGTRYIPLRLRDTPQEPRPLPAELPFDPMTPAADAIPRPETAEQREEDHDDVPDTGPSTNSSAADTSGTSESSPGSSSTTGPKRRQIRPPVRPAAFLQAAMAQPSQTAHQAPHCLQDGPVHCVLRKLCQPRFQADHLHHLWQIAPWK